MVRNVISEFIPNPTFSVVARLSLLDHFDGISEPDIRKSMGGNMLRLLGIEWGIESH